MHKTMSIQTIPPVVKNGVLVSSAVYQVYVPKTKSEMQTRQAERLAAYGRRIQERMGRI